MKKIDKPSFLNNNTFNNIIGFIGFIIGIVQFLIPEKFLPLKIKIYIVVLIIIIYLIMYIVQYIINWNKFYNEYIKFKNKFDSLENRYTQRTNEIKNKDTIIKEYEKIIENLNIFIVTSLTKNSATETRQIKNLQEFLYTSAEHLAKMKGEL